MKWFFIGLVFLHGLLHLPGFVKGIELSPVKGITQDVSRPIALLWLLAALLFIVYGISYALGSKFSWTIGLAAVLLSQVLTFLFWKDAKWGSLPNMLIVVNVVIGLGVYRFQSMVEKETTDLLSSVHQRNEMMTDSSDADLPICVQKWLIVSGALGKPHISSGRITQQLEMKMKPEHKSWMEATAQQYTVVDDPAFIWTVDAKMNSLFGFRGRDKFVGGKGEMLIKMNGLVNIVNSQGPKLDEGSLQRYLGEMVWFPSLAMSPYIKWETINDSTAKATLSYHGTTGSGVFHFGASGKVTSYAAMRYKDNTADARRYEWVMSIEDYKTFEGINVPSRMNTTWRLDDGDWTWLKLEVVNLEFNPRRASF